MTSKQRTKKYRNRKRAQGIRQRSMMADDETWASVIEYVRRGCRLYVSDTANSRVRLEIFDARDRVVWSTELWYSGRLQVTDITEETDK